MPKKALRMRLYPTEAQTHILNQYCGKTHDRDLNAALNILQEGEKGLAELLPAHPSSTFFLVNSTR